MHVKSICFLFFFCGMTITGINAQQTDWSLPTPREELSTSLIPYPREVIRKEEVVRFTGLEADKASKTLWENQSLLKAELEDVCFWWGMDKQKKGKRLPVRLLSVRCEKAEAYVLDVSDKEVTITAGDFPGSSMRSRHYGSWWFEKTAFMK